ncbi:MAG: DUF2461 domain-containing protein [Bacteroidia bacterium]|nr:DUF2461 domain-containing protein [Bacteroidia bacterium]
MLQPATLQFLSHLKENNHKDWFQENRKSYEAAKANFLQFLEEVLAELSKSDPTLKGIAAKDTIFRINKDIRFSKDKSPYKTNFGSGISRDGKKLPLAGYYIHLEPGKSFLAGGIYMPEPEKLKIIREEIAYDSAELDAIFRDKQFNQYFKGFDAFDKLATAPKGFDKNHPKIEWLKQKSFIVSVPVNDAELTVPGSVELVSSRLKTIVPLVVYLNKLLGK